MYSDQYCTIDSLAVIFPTDNQQAHFCTDKPRQPVSVSISSILLLFFVFFCFLLPRQSLTEDKLQDVRTF